MTKPLTREMLAAELEQFGWRLVHYQEAERVDREKSGGMPIVKAGSFRAERVVDGIVVVVRGVRWIGPGRVPLVVGAAPGRARSAAEPSPSKAAPAADPAESDPKEGAS